MELHRDERKDFSGSNTLMEVEMSNQWSLAEQMVENPLVNSGGASQLKQRRLHVYAARTPAQPMDSVWAFDSGCAKPLTLTRSIPYVDMHMHS